MRKQTRLAAGVLALAMASLAVSCASGTRVFVNPEADVAFYKKVAVLPFTNLSSNALAGARVTRAFITELILANRFQVVQPEDFVAALRRAGTLPGADGNYDPVKLKDAAVAMGITGILRGAVHEYEMARSDGGETPVLAFDAELMDASTGDMVWRSSISKRGKGRIPIFGSKSRSLGRLTQDACADLVGRLKRDAL